MRRILAVLILGGFTAVADGADLSLEYIQDYIDHRGPVATEPVVCVGACPPALALIREHTRMPRTVDDLFETRGHCEGTLIAPDRLLTASHCIPGPDLIPLMRVTFPAAGGFATETVGVAEVLAHADLTQTPLLDFAVLRLTRATERPPLRPRPRPRPRPRGPDAPTPFVLFSHEARPDRIELVRRECTPDAGFSFITDREDVTLRTTGCRNPPGTSGGPVVTTANELAAVVWGGTLHSSSGVNVACIPNVGDGDPARCAQNAPLLAARLENLVAADAITALREYLAIELTLAEAGPHVSFGPKPVCVLSPPEHPVRITAPRLNFLKHDLEKALPLDAKVPFTRDEVTFLLDPQDRDVKVTTRAGSRLGPPRRLRPCPR